RIVAAVGDLLRGGTFPQGTVEEGAARAGGARATLYQHFGSRLRPVHAMCETDATPPPPPLKPGPHLPPPRGALAETVAQAVRFWAEHEAMLGPLYGVAAVDDAAQRLVERQTNDRRSVMRRLVANLRQAGRLRPDVTDRRALALVLLVTSF